MAADSAADHAELARGCYRYWRDGELQPIAEPWSLVRAGNGLTLRSQRVIQDGPVLAVAADYRGADCIAFSVEWRQSTPRLELSARYRLREGRLEWSRTGAGHHARPLPPGCLLFPLVRAAAGPLVRRLAGQHPRWVLLPWLRDAAATDQLLHPLLSERRTSAGIPAGTGELHYRYYGGEYGETGADYWLNAHGLLARYRWDSPQGGWEVRLDDYWSTPAFAGFG